MNILEVVHKRRVDGSPALTMLFNDAKHKLPAEASMTDFMKWSQQNVSVVSPLLILQIKLRKKLLGERYWVKLLEYRYNNPDLTKPEFMKQLQRDIIKAQQESKMRVANAEKEKLIASKASMSASQKNIMDKESVLLEKYLSRSNSQVLPRTPSQQRLDSTDPGDDELDSPTNPKKSRKHRPASAKKPPSTLETSESQRKSKSSLVSEKSIKKTKSGGSKSVKLAS
jgi:hypothetical protein